MASASKTGGAGGESAMSGWSRRAWQYALGPGRSLSLMLAIVLVGLGLWWLGWQWTGARVLSTSDYLVDPEEVTTTPLPPWIHTNVCAEVLRDASLDPPLSIMDRDLAERVYTAFSFHPWVARVERVTKHYAGRITVDLVYREPALMVEVEGGLLPVDAGGVLLPSNDFSPVEASRYPRLEGIDSVPLGPVGSHWGDERVSGAAEIAAALASVWHDWKLDRIVPYELARQGRQREFTYHLYTLGGTRIFWGPAPSSNAAGEMPSAEKVARLTEYFAERGSFDGGGSTLLDVHHLPLP